MITEIETTTAHYKKLVNVFGKNYVSSAVENPFDFILLANKGIDAAVIKNFKSYFDLSRDSIAHMLNVSEPTLYRWTKVNKRLERNFSVKLFEITDLFLYGIEVFGEKENFFKWLKLPNTSLGGLQPYELIEIPGGVAKVKDILGRIEHGVYS